MTTRIATLSALALTAMIALAGALVAQQEDQDKPDVRIQAGDVDIQADVDRAKERRELRETGLREEKPLIHRASALIGLNVKNSADKQLGEIHDLAIDGKTGKIEYAAVSFGGFVGIGDKLFAVPWDSLQIKRVGDAEKDNWVAVMEVSEATLKNTRGFDKDNWPDMADERWRAENDRVFRTTEREDDTTPRR